MICELNSKGAGYESRDQNILMGAEPPHFYNADDYITGYRYRGSGFSVQYTLINGNITGHKQTNAASGKTNRHVQLPWMVHAIHTTTHAGYFPGSMFGKTSRNPLRFYHVKMKMAAPSFRADHTYELDGSGSEKTDRLPHERLLE